MFILAGTLVHLKKKKEKKKAVLILRFNCSVDFNTTDVLIIGPLSSLAVKSSLTQLTE